jgi:molybdopterin/thiamine biosynthesis adenylyltransferase
MNTERDRVREIMINMAKGKETGKKIKYDKTRKTINVESPFDYSDPDEKINITPEDTKFYVDSAKAGQFGMIVLSGELIMELNRRQNTHRVLFVHRPGEDVYSFLGVDSSLPSVPGSINFVNDPTKSHIKRFGHRKDHVRVLLYKNFETYSLSASDKPQTIVGYTRNPKGWGKADVQIVPVRDEIFSRFGGLLETDALAGQRVFIPGLGSGGSQIALEMAKLGITDFDIMDHDRLEVGNVARHASGISNVGRYKSDVMRELILEKNPFAKVRAKSKKVSWDNVEMVRKSVKEANLIVCATDSVPPTLILNRLCVEENTPCIFAGAFRRAYGGQILFVRPGSGPCYQCFLMTIPEQARDMEISNRNHAETLAYTDRPVSIEPGLSNDIAPIGTMVVKLALNQLLKGRQTTLDSLDEDLVAPWYLWLNRREKGTTYENLNPLEYNVDGMSILRWYGIDLRRNENCPVCGNFGSRLRDGKE